MEVYYTLKYDGLMWRRGDTREEPQLQFTLEQLNARINRSVATGGHVKVEKYEVTKVTEVMSTVTEIVKVTPVTTYVVE